MARSTRKLDTVAVMTTVVAAAAVGFRLISLGAAKGPSPVAVVSDWEDQKAFGIGDGADSPLVSVIIFSDYFCGSCRTVEPIIDSLKQEHGPDLGVTWRSYPFVSPQSELAAAAAVCAEEFGVFQAAHRDLFVLPLFGSSPDWMSMAKRLGVADPSAFADCTVRDDIRGRVEEEKLAARKIGIRSTPTFLIDSLLYTGFPGVVTIERSLRRAADTQTDGH